jgi:O-antigen/teichoic acid export membrane protein
MTGYRGFWKGVSKLGFGNFAAQTISIFSLPFVTRAYSPEEFGIYTFVISICTLLIPVATLRFETLIVISKDQNEAQEISRASIFFSFWISCISCLLALIYYCIFERKSLIGSITFGATLGIILFVQSVNIVYIQYLIQQRDFYAVTRSSVTQNAITPLIQVIVGVSNNSYLALGVGYVIGRFMSTLRFYKIEFLRSAFRYGLSNFKDVYIQRISASRKLIIASIFEVLINLFPLIFVSLFFGSVYSGYLGVAQTLTYAPIALISGAISNVMLSSPSTLAFPRKYVARLLFFISFLFSFLVIIISELPSNYMGSILGKDWADVGEAVRILVLPALISLVYHSLSTVVLKDSNWSFYRNANILRFIVGVSALLLSHLARGNWLDAVLAFTYAIGLVQIIIIVVILRKFLD